MNDFDDTIFYDQVAAELENNERKDGLWLKAQSLADGDESKVKLHYVRLRVEQLYKENAEIVEQEKLNQQHAQKETKEKLQIAEALKNMDVVRTHDLRTFSFSHIVFWPSLLFPIWASLYLLIKGEIVRGIIVFLVTSGIISIVSLVGYFTLPSELTIISYATVLGYFYYVFTVSNNVNRWLSERAHGINNARQSLKLLEQDERNLLHGTSSSISANMRGAETLGQSTSQHIDMASELQSGSENTSKSEKTNTNKNRPIVIEIILGLFFCAFAIAALLMVIVTFISFQDSAVTGFLSATVTWIFAALAYYSYKGL